MKKSLMWRLLLYFVLAILAFVLIVGAIFVYRFQAQSEARQVRELTHLARNLTNFVGDFSRMPPPRGRGPFERSLMELNRLSQGEIWIVDGATGEFITYGKRAITRYDITSPEAGEMIRKVLAGENAVSRSFSPMVGAPTMTVGVPIPGANGKPKGALLLHRPLTGFRAVQNEAFSLLAMATLIALLVSLPFAFFLARRFITPLRRMEEFAGELAEEHYHLRSGVKQEDEIGSLAKSLDLLAARLEEIRKEKARLDKMRQDFLASVSHELKTPITVLRGLLELMTSGLVKDGDKKKDLFRQMTENILGMQRLVQDLFELARLQNVDFTIEKTELNLMDPLEEAVQSGKQMAAGKNLAFTVQGNEAPIVIMGDYGRLRQMFLTIVDNAVKFSPSEGEIAISIGQEGDTWSIAISDEGKGVAPEELDHIFDRFHSGKTKENLDGTGLGLPIAKEIALRHNMEIVATNREEGGACFTVSGKFI